MRDEAGMLVLEASSAHGSLALVRGGRVEAVRQVTMGAGREDALFPALQALLEASPGGARQLSAIVCGSGPGSFTSLRIAAAMAKGLAHGVGCPLHAVPSLLLAAAGVPDGGPDEFVVHADALRSERFVLAVGRGADGRLVARTPVERVSADWLLARVPPHARVAVGTPPLGLEGWCSVQPEAAGILRVASAAYETPVDRSAWEPVYGRLAEAQVQWEQRQGHPLPSTGPSTA